MTVKIGLDCGTYNLLVAQVKNNNLEIKREVNAFFTIPIENAFMINMLKQSGAPFIEVGQFAYILGQNAVDLALSMGKEYQRPMKNGILSVNEKDAFNILAVMIRSLIGPIEEDGSIIYYSIPADAINSPTKVEYHRKVIQAILDKYTTEGKRLKAYPINEGLCVVMSELGNKNYTGIGISCGAGQVNLNFAIFGVPVVQFSLTDSGDWISDQASKNCGETSAFIDNEKKKIDLSIDPQNSIERSIHYHYEIMIENTLKGIREGIIKAGTKANPGKPVDIVIAGGTAMPKGFIEFFKKTFSKNPFPIEIGEIRLSSDPLSSVVKGALIAAEAHKE